MFFCIKCKLNCVLLLDLSEASVWALIILSKGKSVYILRGSNSITSLLLNKRFARET